jgi:hypothetical protein
MFYVEFFRALEKEGVRYLVVGGVAVNLHGAERLTMDIDIMLDLDADNLHRFLAAIQPFGLRPANPLVTLAQFCDTATVESWVAEKHMLAFQLRPASRSGPSLNVLLKPAVLFEAAYARRVRMQAGGVQLSIAAAADHNCCSELTDEHLLEYSALPAIAKLRWLDEARRFTILMRGARRTYYRDGVPAETVVPAVEEPR